MMLYDVLKASKGLYVDDEYAMLWGKQLGGWTVTTLTGALPITFRSNGTALIDYRIYGTADGAGVQTENEFNVDIVQGYYNTTNGIFIPNSARYVASGKVSIIGGQEYTLSFDCDKQASSATSADGFIYFWNNDLYIRGTSMTNKELCTFTVPNDANTVAFIVGAGSGGELIPSDVTNIMLIKGSTPPETYIPYGYQLLMQIKQRTKNLVDLSSVTDSVSTGVTYTVDSKNGTIIANRIATSTFNSYHSLNMILPAGTYIFSCSDNPQRDVTYDCYLRASGSTIARDKPDDPPGSEFTIADETTVTVYIRIQASYDAQNLVFRPMIRKDDTTSDFEPYYNIKQADIYIGDTKLGADDYVDYESGKIVRNGTPQDPPLPLPELETFEGTNTLDSTVEVGEVTIKGMIKEAE